MKVSKDTEKQIKKLGEETYNAAILTVLMSTIDFSKIFPIVT